MRYELVGSETIEFSISRLKGGHLATLVTTPKMTPEVLAHAARHALSVKHSKNVRHDAAAFADYDGRHVCDVIASTELFHFPPAHTKMVAPGNFEIPTVRM